MEPLSAFVTTYNNGLTLNACLASVAWADEIVVLDSGSQDDTLAIAQRYGAKIFHHPFMGYGPQKQLALEKTTCSWVLLLDADEALTPLLQQEIKTLLANNPKADGYEIPRLEQLFWRMSSPNVRMNHFLRLFRRERGRLGDMPIHAAPQVIGVIARLHYPFWHFGEISIHAKVDRINAYSTGLVADKVTKRVAPNPWSMVFYPPFVFVRSYLFKRNFLNGWAGFIGSVSMAYYAFLKYAKLYEYNRWRLHGRNLLPPEAPPGAMPPPPPGTPH